MNPVRKRRMIILLSSISIIMLVVGLTVYALRQNISLFYTPLQVVQGDAPLNRTIRLGGMVVTGSVIHHSDELHVTFKLTDFKKTLVVSYRGILPDLFREGQGVVALGQLTDNHHFRAMEVLAKHDANYMPPEIKDLVTKAPSRGGDAPA